MQRYYNDADLKEQPILPNSACHALVSVLLPLVLGDLCCSGIVDDLGSE